MQTERNLFVPFAMENGWHYDFKLYVYFLKKNMEMWHLNERSEKILWEKNNVLFDDLCVYGMLLAYNVLMSRGSNWKCKRWEKIFKYAMWMGFNTLWWYWILNLWFTTPKKMGEKLSVTLSLLATETRIIAHFIVWACALFHLLRLQISFWDFHLHVVKISFMWHTKEKSLPSFEWQMSRVNCRKIDSLCAYCQSIFFLYSS